MMKKDFSLNEKPTFRNADYYINDYQTAKSLGKDIDPDFEDPERAE